MIPLLGALAACGGTPAPPGGAPPARRAPPPPRAAGPAGAAAAPPPGGRPRPAPLPAAANCTRQHGTPTSQDPVLTPDGHVFTDARSIQNASDETIQAAQHACAAQISQAQFQPDAQSPAPP